MSAGFPSPAQDYQLGNLDLNSYLIKHPAATFFMRMKGDSMVNFGIFDNDLLIVDRSIEPRNNSIIITVLNGEFRVNRFRIIDTNIFLESGLKSEKIKITEDIDFTIWGVVTKVIHEL